MIRRAKSFHTDSDFQSRNLGDHLGRNFEPSGRRFSYVAGDVCITLKPSYLIIGDVRRCFIRPRGLAVTKKNEIRHHVKRTLAVAQSSFLLAIAFRFTTISAGNSNVAALRLSRR